MAAIHIGAMSKTMGLSSDTLPYEQILVTNCYITFIKNNLPQPASTVEKICNGSTAINGEKAQP